MYNQCEDVKGGHTSKWLGEQQVLSCHLGNVSSSLLSPSRALGRASTPGAMEVGDVSGGLLKMKKSQGPVIGIGPQFEGGKVKLRNQADAQLASPGARPMLGTKYHRLHVESHQRAEFEGGKVLLLQVRANPRTGT